ncbi:MAG: DUF4132 domain-containing protein [Ktedonobacterales bacterium]
MTSGEPGQSASQTGTQTAETPAMTEAEASLARIERIAAACRANKLPEPFIVALVRYLGGQTSLADVQREWKTEYLSYPHAFLNTLTHTLTIDEDEDEDEDETGDEEADEAETSGAAAEPEVEVERAAGSPENERNRYRFNDLERRIIDLCQALGPGVHSDYLHTCIGYAAPLAELRDYVVSHGMSEQDFLNMLVAGTYSWGRRDASQRTDNAFLLTYMPDRFQMLFNTLGQRGWGNHYARMVDVLCSAEPPYLDEAWLVVQEAEKNSATSSLDECADILLKADYVRFHAWAQHLVEVGSPLSEYDRANVFNLLFPYDPAAHLELALKLTQEPVTSRWGGATVQRAGLTALFTHDPVAWWYLIEQAATDKHLAGTALQLITGELDTEQPRIESERGREALRSCIATGEIDEAIKALRYLLARDWPERLTYVLSLLPHRSKQVRDEVIGWLAQQSEQDTSIFERVAPFATHKNADARLAAVEALGRIDTERANTLLAPLADAEKSQKVRQAIYDLAQVGREQAKDDAGAQQSSPTPQALRAQWLAEAEKTLKRGAKPASSAEPATALPEADRLRWLDGAQVEPLAASYLLYQQGRVKDGELAPSLTPITAQIDHATSADFALALITGWVDRQAPAKESWRLALAGALGDDRLTTLLRQQIDVWGKGTRGAVAAKASQALALIGSDLALSELNDIATRFKHTLVRETARAAFANTAERLGVSEDELNDRIVPRLGLDEQGKRILDYGGAGERRFTVKLGLDLALTVTDANGKRISAPPKPGAKDDAAQASQALADWKRLKTQTQQAIKLQTQRLQDALIMQRSWTVDRWQTLYLRHPLLCPFATRLVWGILAPDAQGDQRIYSALFRPMEDGTLTDANDEPVDLPAEGYIRLAHPVELDEATQANWVRHLSDYEVTPPFAQLNRTVVRVQDDERERQWWDRYQGYLMNGAALRGRFEKAGWQRGSVQDAGAYFTLFKQFPTAGIEAVLETAGLSVGYEMEFTTALKRLAFVRMSSVKRGSYVYDDLKEQDERTLKLGVVPLVVFSEAAADVQGFAAAGAYAEDWEKKVW